MEGAVRSGYLAAEAVLRSATPHKKFLQADLRLPPLTSLRIVCLQSRTSSSALYCRDLQSLTNCDVA